MDITAATKASVSNTTFMDMEVVNTEGFYFYDGSGKKYLDFLSGWCVGNLGWARDDLRKAIREFDGPAYVYPHFHYKPWDELADLLGQLTPGPLNSVFRTTGGTESVDAALQIAMAFTERSRFLSLEGSYHGNSISAISIGDSESSKQLQNNLSGCTRLPPTFDDKMLVKAEKHLAKKNVAAFIMEPVICNLSVKIPSKEFMKALERLCRKYGTLLIMDEVATGFGRTGRLFATEHFGIEPDVMCLSKAITNGYAGLGAVMTTERIAKKVKGKVSIYSTYGWHPLSVQVAIANLRFIMENRNEILKDANEMSVFFSERLSQMKIKGKKDVRVMGMAIAVELNKSGYAGKLQQRCMEEGLMISSQAASLVMFPPLNIDKETAEKGLSILESCI